MSFFSLYVFLYLIVGWIVASTIAYVDALVDDDNRNDEVLFFVIYLLFWPVPSLLVIARLAGVLIEYYLKWLRK